MSEQARGALVPALVGAWCVRCQYLAVSAMYHVSSGAHTFAVLECKGGLACVVYCIRANDLGVERRPSSQAILCVDYRFAQELERAHGLEM